MSKSLPVQCIFLLLLSLFWQNSIADNDDGDSNEHASSHADFSVSINGASQLSSGIEILELRTNQFNPEIETFAVSVDLAPLFKIRKDYLSVRAEQQSANIQLQQSQRNVLRLQSLQRDQAVSTRKLREQQVQLKINQVQFNTARLQTTDTRLYAKIKWGNELSRWFLDESSADSMLNALKKPLYLVYLPKQIASPSKTIFIQPFGLREKAHSASLISTAPLHENNQQQAGTPFFYLSDQTVQGHHQRVVAWLPVSQQKLSGVIIPASALVWHLGQVFVYLQQQDNDEQFTRIKITEKKFIHSDAYFIDTELQAGDRLVSIGAQMLLSEEFSGQIPAEDDD
ncbi:MAG TPA: hypothetical protein EYQ43_10670 [Methyloprofundus sp.]|uniref:hypothetical protein n=1 Tax=Methyloprofundus sp. TaxID=2020875 RepID=UPI001796C72A|nr:hypothetical protein [Methyloprofundus sp.]HIG65988.1 hypothetical protein [Methyloprofundus sp.]HIL79501.1 hypothetical protein [Methylococcales bacterium]